MKRPLAALTLLLAPTVAAAQANVLVVDETGAPGTEYTTLQAAIDAAVEGDLLLIRPGYYDGTIDGKSLVLQAETRDTVFIGPLEVKNVAPAQSVVLRDCSGSFATPMVQNCGGTVRFERGTYYGLTCTSAQDLVLVSVKLASPSGIFGDCLGGLDATGSTLYIYHSIIYGGAAYDIGMGATPCSPTPGITMQDSSLYLQGSFVSGADECGFNCWFWTYCPEPGIVATGSVRSLELVDTGVKGGKRNTCPAAPVFVGVTPTIRPGNARRVATRSPVIEGQTTSVQFYGDPGDFVFLAMSPNPALAQYYAAAGAYHGELTSSTFQAVGTIPASGAIVHSFQVPAFGGLDPVTSFYLQALFVAPSEKLLGAPTHVYVLDPAY